MHNPPMYKLIVQNRKLGFAPIVHKLHLNFLQVCKISSVSINSEATLRPYWQGSRYGATIGSSQSERNIGIGSERGMLQYNQTKYRYYGVYLEHKTNDSLRLVSNFY